MNTTSKMIGYKIARTGLSETRVVVTLEIPDDAITNMSRKDIVNMNTATHRTNKATVLKIEDANGKEYSSASSFNYAKKSLEYVVGNTIVVNDYDMDLEKASSKGIHFFLTRRCAELYGLLSIQNGLFESWNNNGDICTKWTYVNGKYHGLYQMWFKNGQKCVECVYVNGQRDGLYQSWYNNGQKCEEFVYVNGKQVGPQKRWNDNGTPQYDIVLN